MSRFSLKQLQIFHAAARFMSFTKAAKDMDISKPAITKQIQNLEEICGVQLFELVGRQIRLTNAAKHLLPQVEAVLEEAKRLESMLEGDMNKTQQTISLSFGHTFANIVFKLIQHFSINATSKIEVSMDNPKQMFKKLENSKVDFIIHTQKMQGPNFVNYQFQTIKFVLVASSVNTLAKKTKVTERDVLQQRFLILKNNQSMGGDMERL